MVNLEGKFLIASPALVDPNFRQSVVLILRHSTEGAIGLIVNRPTQSSLADVWGQISDSPCPGDPVLYLGGPCEGPLTLLHQSADADDSALGDHVASVPTAGEGVVFITNDPEHLQSLVERGGSPLRCFIGYSGWGPMQLEGELATESWLVTDATVGHIFSAEAEALWGTLHKQTLRERALGHLPSHIVPPDPRLN